MAVGVGRAGFVSDDRVGVPWLGGTGGHCAIAGMGRENLCDAPSFTGYTLDGGYATHVLADARYCLALRTGLTDVEAAPLMCAGLIGYRSLEIAGGGRERSASTASARRRTSSRRSRHGRGVKSTPSRDTGDAGEAGTSRVAGRGGRAVSEAARRTRRRDDFRPGGPAHAGGVRRRAQGRASWSAPAST